MECVYSWSYESACVSLVHQEGGRCSLVAGFDVADDASVVAVVVVAWNQLPETRR